MWDKESIGLGKCTGWPFGDLRGCDLDKQKFACLQNKVRTCQPITTKLISYIPLVMLSTWLDFGGILLETFFAKFSLKFFMCFFKVKHSIAHISGMVGPIDVEKGGALVGELCDLDLWPHLWPWPCSFKVKVWNSRIWGIWGGGGGGCWLTWNERDVSRSFVTVTVSYGLPWWGGWMYRIVTGVASDISMPSTDLVTFVMIIFQIYILLILASIIFWPFSHWTTTCPDIKCPLPTFTEPM